MTVTAALKRIVLVGIVAILAGCSSIPDWKVLTSYEGKFSVLNGAQNQSGTYSIDLGKNFIDLSLMGPLGITVAKVHSDPQKAVLTISGENPIESTDMDSLIERILGFRLSVATLLHWIEGHPDPATPYETKDGAKNDFFRQKDIAIRIVKRNDRGEPVLIRIADARSGTRLTLTVLRQ